MVGDRRWVTNRPGVAAKEFRVSMVISETRQRSSAEFATIDVDRVVEIEDRQHRVAAFLESTGFEALLLRRPENVAWFTAGADVQRFGVGESTAALLVTADARVVATNDVESPRLFEHELAGMGFQLKERPWHEDPRVLVDDICRGRRVAADDVTEQTEYAGEAIHDLRLPLSPFDVKRLRELGRIASHAVEATCRKLEPGRTELEVAAELAHRSVKHGTLPTRLVVQGDGRGDRYPHWTPQQFPVNRYCHVGVTLRRWGLHASATRTVCLQRPDNEFVRAHHVAMLAQATGMHFARAGRRMADVWAKVERIYDKFGEPDAWREADQAELVGYSDCERVLVPNGEHVLRPGEPIHWHPSVGPTATGDTMVVLEDGGELLTPMEEWPRLTIAIKGRETHRPALLRRDRDDE